MWRTDKHTYSRQHDDRTRMVLFLFHHPLSRNCCLKGTFERPMTKTQRFTLAATSLGLFMIYLDALIVNVALPATQSDFKAAEAGLGWAGGGSSFGMTIAIMSSGTPAYIYGRRKLY